MGLINEYLSLIVNMKWESVFLFCCLAMAQLMNSMFSFVSGISSICVSEVSISKGRVYVYGA